MPETRFIQRKIKYIVHRVLFILLGLLACDNAFGQGSQNWCNGITSDVSIPDTAYCLGIGLTLTNSTSDTHALAVTHSWNFNGESSSADSLPVFTFTTPGTKQIYYSATNSHGCQVFDTLEVDIVKYYPHISVNDVSQCLSTNEFDLSDSSYSFPTGFQSASRNWVLTGHQSSTDSSFSYTYSVDSNEYAVKLTTVNTLGCVADTTLYVNVNPMPKMAVSYIDSALCFYGSASDTFKVVENATVEITNNSTSTISSYEWQYGSDISTNDTLFINPTGVGTNTFLFIAETSDGCKDTLEGSFSYYKQPTAVFTVNDTAQCLDLHAFEFIDASTSNLSNASLTYAWNFGDGTTSASADPTKVYGTAGRREVELIVTNNQGCTDTANETITTAPNPVMNFTIDDDKQCENQNEFTFTNTSSLSLGGTLSYEWNSPDGHTASSTNYTRKIYLDDNTYGVKLIATSSYGCKDSATKNITLDAKPTANFTVNDTAQCLDLHAFEFIDASTSNLSNASLTYAWNFGDGTTSASADPTKVYGTAGRREVELIVTNNQGCTDTANETITTAPNPVMNFTIDDDKQCENQNEFTFTNTSSLSLGGTLSYEWNSPDGHTASSTNYTRKIYLDDNTYGVKLIATSSYGCKDSATKNITLDAKPVALISNTSADSCLNSLWYFKVKDLSAATMKSQSWTFPDASTSIDSLVQYSFQSNGSKTLSVIIENDNSCFDTTDFDINVYTNPVAGFDFDDSTQCFDIHRFKLSNTTTHSASTISYSWNFGDSSSTITANPTKVFNYAGYKNITLITTDNYGCADTIEQEAFVVPHPISDFNIPDNQQCENHNLFIFKNASTVASNAGTLSSSWDFGDGSSTTGDSVSYNYATTTGIVTVIHTATSSYGCTDTSQGVVHIQSGPSADFVMDTVLYCIRGNVHGFTDASGSGEGSNDTYVWTWGDGNQSNLSTTVRTTHTYGSAGTYTIKLWVSDDNGCYDSTSKTTTIHPNPTSKFAITDSLQCINANEFTFTNQSKSNTTDASLTYAWNFDDTSSTDASPTITYSNYGSRDISLEVSNIFGCKDTFDSKLRVYALPQVSFTINDSTQCENNQSFSFIGGSSIAAGEGTLSSAWDLGDGTTTTTTDVSHGYANHDTVLVKLVMSSLFGCKDSLSKRVEVLKKPGIDIARTFTDSCVDSKVSFRAIDREVSSPFSSTWSFSNGFTSTDSLVETKYASEGSKNLRLIVGNERGCLDTLDYNFDLYDNPIAGFYAQDSAICLRGNEFEFDDTTILNYGTADRYVWHFGDGDSYTSAVDDKPKHTYADTGTYTVQLQITNSLGCADTTKRMIRVEYHPVTTITKTNSDSCLNTNWGFKVSDQLENTVSSADWSFPGGSTYSSATPSHTFASNGAKSIEVQIENQYGCRDTQTLQVNVYVNPIAGFSINDTGQCFATHRYVYTNASSSLNSLTHYWDFGDTTNSSAKNALKIYNSRGRRTVKLVSTDPLGCADSASQEVYVAPYPTAGFVINDTLQCENHNLFSFEESSSIIAGGGSISHEWSFGDSQSGSGDSVRHNYATYTGYATVEMKAISSYGCRDSISKIVHIQSGPSADFVMDTVLYCIRGNVHGFTDASGSGEGSNDTYVWTWGDGNQSNLSTTVRTTHTYGSAGTYTIKLWVSDDNGCYDSTSKTTTIHPNPTSKFAITDSLQCINANEFTFTNQSKSNTTDASLTYAWNFDDTSSTDASPTITYSNYGSRDISLEVSNIFGCKDTFDSKLRVYALPQVSFTINDSTQCENNQSFSFIGGSSIAAGEGTLSSAWDLGDGTTTTTTDVSHGYANHDTVLVKLVMSSLFGCKDSLSKRVEVLKKPGIDIARTFTDSCVDSKVSFRAIDREVSSPFSSTWSFSNGFTSTDSLVETKYASEGSKNLRLIVGNERGCLDTLDYNFDLYDNPIAGFYAQDSAICLRGNEFEFDDTTILNYGTADRYVWHFGDGDSYTSAVDDKPKHTYADTGTYTVQLQITNSLGCADTTKRMIRVEYHPVTTITKTNSDSCLNNTAEFKVEDALRPTMVSVTWNFDDATTQTDSIVSKQYSSDGAKNIEVLTQNIFGCIDTAEINFTLYDNPEAGFSRNDTFLCLQGNQFDFITTSTTKYGSIINNDWDFGDAAGTSTSTDPSYVYTDSGYYSVLLVSTNDLGCADSLRKWVRVNPNPRVHFNADTYLQCLNENSTQFTDSSESNLNDATLTYQWSFGDDSTATVSKPKHTYLNFGFKNIMLIVTNADGCPDTLVRKVEIKPEPIAKFVIDDAAQCVNTNLFTFNDTTVMPVRGGSHIAQWFVSDGHYADSSSTISHRVDSAKTYTMKLIAISEFGCKDSIEKPFRVYPKPIAKIEYLSVDSCLTSTGKFKALNTASNGIKNAHWLFSDSTRATGEEVNKKFVNHGSKWVELIIENANGCFDTTRFEYNIHRNPKSYFYVGNYSQCLNGNEFSFYDTSKAIDGKLDSVVWYFADGNSKQALSGSSTQYSFTVARSYRVRMLAFNSFGCQDSMEQTVVVKANPTADFDINNSNQCLKGNSFELTNRTLSNNGNPGMSFTWSLGDTTSRSSKNVTKNYTYHGAKSVRLIATNTDGCLDTVIKSVTVYPMPVAKMDINTFQQCVNQNAYKYTDNSTIAAGGGNLSRVWNLGDGNVSNRKVVNNKNYTAAKNFNIRLISKSNLGCADTLVEIITVLPKPNISFNVNRDTQCLVGNTFKFSNNTSIVSGGGTLSYDWNFGDGSTSQQTHPSYRFGQFGTYTVKMKSTTQNGCVDSLKRIVKVVANPDVNFTFSSPSKQCNSVDTFKIDNQTGARNGFALNYMWDLGDSTISTIAEPVKNYAQSGTYTLKLIVQNSTGCKDSASKSVTVYADPIADFAINDAGQCLAKQNFEFTNNSAITYGGGTLSYQWKYADTQWSTTKDAKRKFTLVKSYPIKLIVSSSDGCKDSIKKNIQVFPQPEANFAINKDKQCLHNNKFNLTNNSKISTGSLSYDWNYGDGKGGQLVSPEKVYEKFGTYSIKLKSVSNRGCLDSIVKSISVHSQPNVSFTLSDTSMCLYNNAFTFTNKTSNDDNSALTYLWSFSDGNTATTKDVTTSFNEAGRYVIKLKANSAYGCIDSSVQTVRIYPQPLPSFVIKEPFQCLNNNGFEVTNNSKIASEGGTLSYSWTFGDANNSTLKEPKWKYSKHDSFDVKLVVKSSFGCFDSLSKQSVVFPEPTVGFTLNDSIGCLGTHTFVMANLSTVDYGSLIHRWSFGDGSNSVGLSPKVTYITDGLFKIRLVTTTNHGCADSAFDQVRVYPDPEVRFDIDDNVQCLLNNKFNFTNKSDIKYGTLSDAWTFGDKQSSNNKSPNHTYADYGIYTVRLIVSSDKGCTDSIQSTLRVHPQPEAVFTLNDSIQCLNDNDFVMENYSSIPEGYLNSFWSYGDVSFSSNSVGRHTYKSAGEFTVRLVARSPFGCTDTMEKVSVITEIPVIKFILDTNQLCLRGNVFKATNNSIYNGVETVDYVWYASDGFTKTVTDFYHNFTDPGKFEIKLIGTTTEGCADSISKMITIFPQGKSKITIIDSVQCLKGNDFIFGNESRVDGARFALMSWDFGGVFVDTVFSISPNRFQFPAVGKYDVTLITTTEYLCQDTSKGTIEVVPMPAAKMKVNDVSHCINEQVFEYTDVSTKPTGYTNEWLYDKKIKNNLDTLRPMFGLPGIYNISLVVKTDFGCTDTSKSIARVLEIPKTRINVNNNEQCLEVNHFEFANAYGVSDNQVFWDFGDSSFGSGMEITQNYINAGDYLVTMIVENDSACVDTSKLNIRVNPTPEADLYIESSCLGVPIYIESNTSITDGKISSFLWNMGDGTNYNLELPSHYYRNAGKYYITLALNSDKGCFGEYKDSINVFENPYSGISVLSERPTILENEVSMMSWSFARDSLGLEWDFGDMSDFFFDSLAVTHKYTDTGNYTVRLVAVSKKGCRDTFYENVRIWPDYNILIPTAFSPNGDFINDEFHVRGNHHSVVNASWRLYTEDGIQVFESTDITEGWNGKYQNTGEDLPMGNYQFVLIVKDMYGNQEQFTEKISIVR